MAGRSKVIGIPHKPLTKGISMDTVAAQNGRHSTSGYCIPITQITKQMVRELLGAPWDRSAARLRHKRNPQSTSQCRSESGFAVRNLAI